MFCWILKLISTFDVDYSVLHRIQITLGRNVSLPTDTPEDNSEDWKKRQKCVHKFKEIAWKRYIHKYLAALQERYISTTKRDVPKPISTM